MINIKQIIKQVEGKKGLHIICSTRYCKEAFTLSKKLKATMPIFDNEKMTELQVVEENCLRIKKASGIILLWDRVSHGVLVDFGMCVAFKKKIIFCWMGEKTFENNIWQYTNSTLQKVSTKLKRGGK